MAQRKSQGRRPVESAATIRVAKAHARQTGGQRGARKRPPQPHHPPVEQERTHHRRGGRAPQSERTIMTAIANTATTLTTKGIHEDLESTIYRVAPFKTPFQANIGAAPKATNTYHE